MKKGEIKTVVLPSFTLVSVDINARIQSLKHISIFFSILNIYIGISSKWRKEINFIQLQRK